MPALYEIGDGVDKVVPVSQVILACSVHVQSRSNLHRFTIGASKRLPCRFASSKYSFIVVQTDTMMMGEVMV